MAKSSGIEINTSVETGVETLARLNDLRRLVNKLENQEVDHVQELINKLELKIVQLFYPIKEIQK